MIEYFYRNNKCIHAIQYLEGINISEIKEFVGDGLSYDDSKKRYYIKKNNYLNDLDYVYREVNGEFYNLDCVIFHKLFRKECDFIGD